MQSKPIENETIFEQTLKPYKYDNKYNEKWKDILLIKSVDFLLLHIKPTDFYELYELGVY